MMTPSPHAFRIADSTHLALSTIRITESAARLYLERTRAGYLDTGCAVTKLSDTRFVAQRDGVTIADVAIYEADERIEQEMR